MLLLRRRLLLSPLRQPRFHFDSGFTIQTFNQTSKTRNLLSYISNVIIYVTFLSRSTAVLLCQPNGPFLYVL